MATASYQPYVNPAPTPAPSPVTVSCEFDGAAPPPAKEQPRDKEQPPAAPATNLHPPMAIHPPMTLPWWFYFQNKPGPRL